MKKAGPKIGSRCLVCQRPDLAEIDKSLSAGTVSVLAISKTYGLDRQSMMRHRNNHLFGDKSKAEKLKAQSASLVAVEQDAAAQFERKTFSKVEDVLASITDLYNEHWRLYLECRARNDARMMSKSLNECGVLSEKLAKAFGMFASDGQVVINMQANIIEKRLTDVVDGMDEEQLRAYIASASDPKQARKQREHINLFSGRDVALPTAESETIEHVDED